MVNMALTFGLFWGFTGAFVHQSHGNNAAKHNMLWLRQMRAQ